MENSFFAVAIKVENIDICRSFYRDILDLGNPTIDSNFWVEFNLPGGFTLILEKKENDEKLPECLGRISWIYKVNDINAVVEKLHQYGYDPINEEQNKLGFKVYVFCDPEGNAFHLRSAQETKS